MTNPITLRLCPGSLVDPPRARHYDVAGCRILADTSVDELEPFEAPTSHSTSGRPLESAIPDLQATREWHETYRGLGLVGGAERHVACRSGPRGYLIDVEDADRFWVSPEGTAIARLASDNRPSGLEIEIALGPALVLTLALRSRFCLHASAAAHGDRIVAFCGLSGSGKSTLAAQLQRQAGLAWRRVADDILPVWSRTDGPTALPHFPQLKLSVDAQSGLSWPPLMPLAAVYILPDEADSRHLPSAKVSPAIRDLTAKEAMLDLVRHTVASRLFDARLAASHMAACTSLAKSVRVAHLDYPHQETAILSVREAISGHLRTPRNLRASEEESVT